MPEDHNKPPATVKEIGIHMGYMWKTLTDLDAKMDRYYELSATKAELEVVRRDREEDRTRITELENWKDGLTNKIAGGAILMFVSMVLALYGLDKFLP